MNVGGEFGRLQLRIFELEAKVEEQAHIIANAGNTNYSVRYNFAPRVRELITTTGPMSIDNIAIALGDVKRTIVAKNMQVGCCQGRYTRTYVDGVALYGLPESAQ